MPDAGEFGLCNIPNVGWAKGGWVGKFAVDDVLIGWLKDGWNLF